MSFLAGSEIGNVFVQTTDHRGFTPEEIAERALNKILYIGDKVTPEIGQQARMYQEAIRQVLIKYLQEAQDSERKNVRERLMQMGHHDIADLIGEL